MNRKQRNKNHPLIIAPVFSFMFSSICFALRRLELVHVNFNFLWVLSCFLSATLVVRWIQVWQNWRGWTEGMALSFASWFLASGPLIGRESSAMFYLEFVSSLAFGAMIAVTGKKETVC